MIPFETFQKHVNIIFHDGIEEDYNPETDETEECPYWRLYARLQLDPNDEDEIGFLESPGFTWPKEPGDEWEQVDGKHNPIWAEAAERETKKLYEDTMELYEFLKTLE